MKRFKSTTGSPVRIARLDGHIAIVDVEFGELHERFHSDAYSNRCISEDMLKSEAVSNIPTKVAEGIVKTATKQQRITDVIKQFVDSNNLEAFSAKTGVPDARIISTEIGERVSGKERDEAWYRYQEAEGDK